MSEKSIHIGGNVTGGAGSLFNIGATLTNVIQSVGQINQGSADERAELAQLLEELRAALGDMPDEQAEAAQAVEVLAEQSVGQLQQKQPNKPLLKATLDGLKTAAQGVIEYAPKAVDLVAKVVGIIGKIAAL